MIQSSSLPFILIPLFVLVGLSGYLWSRRRFRRMLDRWAANEGYEIVFLESQWFGWGPFPMICSKNNALFRIIVKSENGQMRYGWVRLSLYWWGSTKEKIEEKWES